MRIPLWIGGPVVIALSAVDATLELQSRAVRGLARTVTRRMSNEDHLRLTDPSWAEKEASHPTRPTSPD